jgi:glyoxylase-like metal-dependent hydrolase (beta-lactamase superfamily II)
MPFIGEVEYHFVSDGVYWSDGGGVFGLVPKVVWEKKLPPDALNRVPLALNCLLLKTQGKTILVDTGLGNKLSDRAAETFGLTRSNGDLLDSLSRLGLTPADIDIVINTHLHADHCGGNTYLDSETGQLTPTFPKAEYWIQRRELADASYPNERTRATYFADNFVPLQQSEQLKIISGDTEILGGLKAVITRGHTRAHQSILIESQGEWGFYTADLAVLGYHFERTAWVSAFDLEPLEQIESKRRWQQWAAQTGATILFGHDTERPAAHLHRDGRHFKLEALKG